MCNNYAKIMKKHLLYREYSFSQKDFSKSSVTEYWIVDPEKERTTVYRYDEDVAPMIFAFDQTIQVGIYKDLSIYKKIKALENSRAFRGVNQI